MISKTLTAHSFYATCRYVLQKPGAEVLVADGVRAHDARLMATDMEQQRRARPGKEVACFHAVLSFHPTERPSDELLTTVAGEYLERLGVVNTQAAVVKHTDRDHLHLHVLANMVNNDGKAISSSWIGLKGKKVAQALTRAYNLVPAEKKDLALTHLEALSGREAARYDVYRAINERLLKVKSLDGLVSELAKAGIETVFKYKGKTDQRQGISFKLGDHAFKGSEVDRAFSLARLEKTFTGQQQTQQERPELTRRSAPGQQPGRQQDEPLQDTAKTATGGMADLLTELLKPAGGTEPEPDIPYPYRRKRKKRQGPKR